MCLIDLFQVGTFQVKSSVEKRQYSAFLSQSNGQKWRESRIETVKARELVM